MTQVPEKHDDQTHHDEHKIHVPGAFGALGEDLEKEKPLSSAMIANSIGGWRGIVDSSLPSLAFLIVYLVNGHVLEPAIWTAVGAAVLIAIWRLFRRQSVQQVLGGLVAVGFSAWLASKTDNAANFFLPTVLVALGYGLAFAISNLVRWPLVGLLVGAATADVTGWRKDEPLRRAYRLATWAWAGMFGIKAAILTPLYLLNLVGPLGIAKIVLGWPVMLLLGFWTYSLVKKPLADYRHRKKAAEEAAESAASEGPAAKPANLPSPADGSA